MSNLSGDQVVDASSSILMKIKRIPNFKFSSMEKPLLELPMKFKTLISYKSRYMKIFENFILIFKLKSSLKPTSVIFFNEDLRLEWIHRFGCRFTKNFESMEFYLCEMKDSLDLRRILSLKCNLLNFHENYKAIKKIGKGSFASVYLVIRKDSSEKRFAVKSFNKDHVSQQEKGKAALLNEIKIMRMLQHPNIIDLKEVYETENSYYMIMEMLEGGSLHDRLAKEKIDKDAIFNIMKGILQGLCQMHKKGIMHRDIKPENILFRKGGNLEEDVCIADLGLATMVDEEMYLYYRCGTPGFVAPEIINLKDEKAHYTQKCDIFSLGIIYHLMLLGKNPFESTKYSKVVEKNKICKFDFQTSTYNSLNFKEKTLLIKMLEPDPRKRISSDDALSLLLSFHTNTNDLPNSLASLNLEEKIENEFFTFDNVASPPQKPAFPLKKSEAPPEPHNQSDHDEKCSVSFIMRTTIMNGLTNTIDRLPVCSETEEKRTKLKRGLSIKIYRFPTMDIQSPNMIASLESAFKGEEKEKRTPETQPETISTINNNHLISIKENEVEEEKWGIN